MWPRLSEPLPFPRVPDQCQSCGSGTGEGGPPLAAWREHDQFDRPENIYVLLCPTCSARLIDPHPRLYAAMGRFEPIPGVMPLCLYCRHRDGLRCTSPKAKLNGGEGITVIGPKPTDVHVCRRGGKGGWMKLYPSPATYCDGKEVDES